ncbi:hypothetical protein JCM5350_005882 [Sporobolomyces pararoseus]
MSYAAAAHHAPVSPDPTPDHSLLVSQADTAPNPDAKHVKVASTQQSESSAGGAAIVPQKRENESQATPASSSSSSAVGGSKKSGKKGKKNKKATTSTSTSTPPESEEKEKVGNENFKSEVNVAKKEEESSDKKEQAKSNKDEPSSKEEKKEEAVEEKKEKVEETESSKSVKSKTSRDEDNGKEDGKEEPAGKGFDTELDSLSSTREKPTVSKDLDQKLADPYVPRANIAATVEHPQGTTENNWAQEHKNESVLQQHVSFFDRDNDGIIWPLDTFVGFHNLGYSLIWCLLAVFLIHPAFSYFTLSSWIPDPLFRIRVKTIHRARHGSDTGVYDSQGRFVSAKFEEIFEKFDKKKKGGLTFFEGLGMIRENRNVLDPIGWIGAFFEWFASYLLIWPKNGIVMKEDLRTIYDGSIFYSIANKESTIRKRDHHFYSGLFKENRASEDNQKFNKKIQ